ncbi:TPA: response regulator transcription factor [Serratia liquefaciens]|nr:response regulator transcription factor [Serratia liquefaciens]
MTESGATNNIMPFNILIISPCNYTQAGLLELINLQFPLACIELAQDFYVHHDYSHVQWVLISPPGGYQPLPSLWKFIRSVFLRRSCDVRVSVFLDGPSSLLLQALIDLSDINLEILSGDASLTEIEACLAKGRYGPVRHFPELTQREKEVLGHLLDGDTANIIAETLMLSPKTVSGYKNTALRKLNARGFNSLTNRHTNRRYLKIILQGSGF